MPITAETYDNRPECVAFAFGRVWYAGAQASRWAQTLFYSQVLFDDNRAGKCYQEADPTAEVINSLVDSDGGTIPLPDAGQIIKMIPLTNTLIVIASNGVWYVTGGSDAFRPNSYFVRKATDMGCVSKRSVVTIEDTVMYTAEDGIYQIGAQEGGRIVATNLTEERIDTFFNTKLSFAQKANSVAVYDYKTKIYSLYYGTDNSVVGCVNLRLKNGAWYPYTFDTTNAQLSATFYMAMPFYSPKSRDDTGTKFLIYTDDAVPFYSINEYNNTNFVDFGVNQVDAYLHTSAMTLDNPQFDKQATYATYYFEPTETGLTGIEDGQLVYTTPSGCLMTPVWSFTNSSKFGKKGQERQIYRLKYTPLDAQGNFDLGQDLITVRERIRGQGTSLQMQFKAEQGKDLRLVGYTIGMSMEGTY